MEFPRGDTSSSLAATAARASMAEKSRRHLYGDAEAQAALLLRHRLFPRAMAWNATQQQQEQTQQDAQQQQQQQAHEWRRLQDQHESHHQSMAPSASSQRQYMLQRQQQALDVSGSFSAQLRAVHLSDQPSADTRSEVPAQARHEAMNFARSFPLLHASSVAENQLRRQKENVNSNTSNTSNHKKKNPFLSGALPSEDAREKLFRTMGKWFDGPGSGPTSAANSRSSFASSTGSTTTLASTGDDGLLQHIPRKFTFENVLPPPISVSFASTAPMSSASSFGHAAFSPVQSSSSFGADGPAALNIASDSLRRVNVVLQDPVCETPRSASFSGLPLPSYAESHGTPSPTNSNSNWSVASEPRLRSPPRNNPSSSYGKKRHRATPAPSLAKALLTGCGAKRCSFEDCIKIAVSKGLCRGHGGGRRCQFTACTKCAQSRSPYCWAHGGGKRCEAPNCRRSRKTKHYCVDHVEMEAGVPLTPADSDESMDGQPSTVASDVDLAPVVVERSLSTSDLQKKRPQVTKSNGVRAKLALQLPSLNDALKRPYPSPDSFQQPTGPGAQQQSQDQRAFYQQQVQKFSFELPKTSR